MVRTLERLKGRSERGAVALETALIVPILLMLVLGIAEYGFAFQDKLLVSNAVQTAARVGSALGNNPDVDLYVLNAVNQGVSGLPGGPNGVERVEIFEANSSGNPTGNINVYYILEANDGPGGVGSCDWSDCPDASSGYGGWAWDPDSRNVDLKLGDLTMLGVRIYYAHSWLTGGIVPLPDAACDNGTPPEGSASPSSNCWVEESIMRLEPLQQLIGS